MAEKTGDQLVGEADKKLKELMDLANKETTYGVFGKKKLSYQDKLRLNIMKTKEQNLRSKGMQKRRVEKGFTKMVGNKEVKVGKTPPRK